MSKHNFSINKKATLFWQFALINNAFDVLYGTWNIFDRNQTRVYDMSVSEIKYLQFLKGFKTKHDSSMFLFVIVLVFQEPRP